MNALTLKDGKLHIVVMPEEPDGTQHPFAWYEYEKKRALAIENSLLIRDADQEIAKELISKSHFYGGLSFAITEGSLYLIPKLRFDVNIIKTTEEDAKPDFGDFIKDDSL